MGSWDKVSGKDKPHAAGPVGVSTIALESMAGLAQELARFDPAQAWLIRHPGGVIKGLCGADVIIEQCTRAGLYQPGAALVKKIVLEPDLRGEYRRAEQCMR